MNGRLRFEIIANKANSKLHRADKLDRIMMDNK